ncbi:MAG TPA: class A beta-lactamase, subclass A2, partial [Pedobacter sp.]
KHLILSLLLLSILPSLTFAANQDTSSIAINTDTLTWSDISRNRAVPVAIYHNSEEKTGNRQLVILSPGYPGKNTSYGYIAKNLAKQGYMVVVVQHDLPTDPAMPSGEHLYQRRLPFWNTGLSNILFVITKLKKQYPGLDYKHMILIGHSNGGDISMLMADRYPKMFSKVISLDNRRVPFPRTARPEIFSIRSKDQVADEGVLPDTADQRKYHITIVKVNTDHDDMGGYGNTQQLDQINSLIMQFLNRDHFAGLRNKITHIALAAKGTVGIAVMDLDTKAILILNGDQRFPMQSVFKFPLAMYILHQVDLGKLSLTQKIHFDKEDLSIPYASPLRDKYPDGNIEITLAELLSYTVSQSDNNGCDRLFRLAGGTQAVNDYIHDTGVQNIAIVATEKQMGISSDVQYTNWCQPEAMLELLKKFNEGTVLSKQNNDFLWKLMFETVNAPNRIRGLLPKGTVVAHKPGTSGTAKDGFTATTNDIGIVELPNKRRFAIVLFVCNSTAGQKKREGAMANITKVIYDSLL